MLHRFVQRIVLARNLSDDFDLWDEIFGCCGEDDKVKVVNLRVSQFPHLSQRIESKRICDITGLELLDLCDDFEWDRFIYFDVDFF